MIGRAAEVAAAVAGFLLGDWFAHSVGIEAWWLVFLVDIVAAGVGALSVGLLLVSIGVAKRES